MKLLTKLHQTESPILRLIVGALLLALTCAGGYAVSAEKTVTLNVDGTSLRVTTMRSRVIDIVQENGFSVDQRDDLSPAGDVTVGDAATRWSRLFCIPRGSGSVASLADR